VPTPLHIPFLRNGSPVPPDEAGRILADEAEEHPVACLNWPQFPYCPDVTFRIAHIQTEIWLHFHVKEARILGLQTRTHGDVYMDSCVEFFITFDGANYYNLEINCIGTPHLGYGPEREHRRFVPLPLMERLAIRSSLGSKPFAEKTGSFEWSLTARIPTACFAFDTLTVLSGRCARVNVYKCGNGLSVPHYVTWLPIKTPTPDYHRPEHFGDSVFE
jgi:hypothetical protein